MLLNYTTSVSGERSVSEIQQKLAKAGAHQILYHYSSNGAAELSGLAFRIRTQFGDMAFQLPANIDAVETVLNRQFKRSRVKREQAARVAWRILKDWIEAQLALIETGMVTFEQVMLPYAQNERGQTLYEALVSKKFAGLLTEGIQ